MRESSSVVAARTHPDGPDEPGRLARIEALGTVRARCPDLDLLAVRAAATMGTPLAAVTVTLRDIQRTIASTGTDVHVAARETSLCTHVIASGAAVVINDAARDPEFAGNPHVGCDGMSLRSYCGVPISTDDGFVIAVLCVADTQPRDFQPSHVRQLRQLGNEVRAILLPLTSPAPPEPLDMDSVRDRPQEWYRCDPLAVWIEREVPTHAELARLTQPRHRRWGWLRRSAAPAPPTIVR